MFNFDYIIKKGIKDCNSKWPEIPDRPYRILITGSCGSGKTNALLNLLNHVLINFIYMLKMHIKQNINY